MKKLIALVIVGTALVWCYFWYVRGENLLAGYIMETEVPVAPVYAPGSDVRGRWESAVPMPSPRTALGAAAVGGKIYVVGGFDAFGRTSSAVDEFDIAKNTWSSARPLPKARHNPAVATDGQRLYVFGGMTGLAKTPIDSLSIYDPASGNWTEGPDLPDPLGAAAVAFFDGKFHLLGGQGIGSSVQAHYSFDPKDGKWTVEEPMISGRDHAAAAELDGRLYVVGGRGGSVLYNLDATEAYDPGTRSWEPREALSAKRSAHGLSSIGGKLYAYGGEAPTLTFGDVYAYDPKADHWRISIGMPTARRGFGYATVDGRIFVIGGGRRPWFSVSDVVETFKP